MQMFVKVIPMRTGTSEPVGEPRMLRCPDDVEPDTILSFLAQRLGEVIDTLWTSTEADKRLGIGWVFPARAIEPPGAVELACVPLIETPGGTLLPMFEVQAEQRRQFAHLADIGSLGTTIVEQPHMVYHSATDEGDRAPPTAGRPPHLTRSRQSLWEPNSRTWIAA